jgi:ssRNA-specific RNase YbeY (16S rRNA maturation enzyme)
MPQRSEHFLRYMLFCLCSIFLLPLAFSANAFASSQPLPVTSQMYPYSAQNGKHNENHTRNSSNDPIVVTSETDAVHFPNYIDFTMTASDTQSAINQATISITFNDSRYSQDTKLRVVKISNPANVITLHWRENTSGNNFHYPGTTVQYNWALQDRANHQHIDKIVNFTTVDTRFTWQHLTQGLLHVNWYNRSLAFGQTLLANASTSINHIHQVLGAGLLQPVNLWVYASNDDFHGALAPGSYEWIGGQAYPHLNEAFISVVDNQDDTLVRDMPHELTHLALHQLIAQGMNETLPTWFDEGMAVYNQFFHEPEMKFRFNQALSSHSLLRLFDIANGFPANGDIAYLAYAQSWNLIDYMYHTFGNAKMALLIQKMNDPQTGLDDDLKQALGVDQLHLENQWRVSLSQPAVITPDQITPTPRPIASTSPQTMPVDNTAPVLITLGSALVLLPIVAIAALLMYQRRKRQRELAVQNAQQILATGYSMPRQPGKPGTSLPPFPPGSRYMPPQGQYMPFYYGMPEHPNENMTTSAASQATQQGSAPVQTPMANTTWQFEYPTYNGQNAANGEISRGNGHSPSRKDVPQE